MRLLLLHTGLFPDRETVMAAVERKEGAETAERFDIADVEADDAVWDEIVGAILRADRVITY